MHDIVIGGATPTFENGEETGARPGRLVPSGG